jgi:hypothetical protein
VLSFRKGHKSLYGEVVCALLVEIPNSYPQVRPCCENLSDKDSCELFSVVSKGVKSICREEPSIWFARISPNACPKIH